MNHFKKNKQKQLRSLLLLKSSEEKEKARFIDYLEITSKFFAALAVLGLILGSFLTHRYLNFIGQPSIFPETMASSSSLTVILFVFALILLIFVFPFLSPYLLISISKELKAEGIKVKNLFPSLFASTLSLPIIVTCAIFIDSIEKYISLTSIVDLCFAFTIFSPYFIYLIQDKVNFSLNTKFRINYKKIITCLNFDKIFTALLYTIYSTYLIIICFFAFIPLLFCFIIYYLYYFIINFSIIKNKIIFIIPYLKLLPALFQTLLICLSMFLYPIFFIIFASNWLPDGYIQYIFLYFLYFLTLLNIYAVANEVNSKNKNNINTYTPPVILAITSFFAASLLSNNFATHMLYPTRFVEVPKNSSWYLLHNNFQHNNGTQEINGVDKNDLFKLKQNFKCSILSEKEKGEKGIICSSIPEQRNNALYGYMAWNLGDTKVFCPPTTDNTKGEKEADKLANECVVISGKSLQILNEKYIDIMPKER